MKTSLTPAMVLLLTDGGCRIGDIKVERIFLVTKPKLFKIKIISKMRHCGNRVLADGG
jgi:hypothetical protein